MHHDSTFSNANLLVLTFITVVCYKCMFSSRSVSSLISATR